jgi:hypothetical protein
MTETAEANHFQAFLDEVTQKEIGHFPELSVNGSTTETDKQGTMIAYIWDNLYPLLYREKRIICPKPAKENIPTEAEKEKIREQNLAKILGLDADELPKVFQRGIPEGQLKSRLEKTFAAVNLFLRAFEDLEERSRNLTFPRPELHGKSPIDSLIAGNTDKVLYFAAMSAKHLDVLG